MARPAARRRFGPMVGAAVGILIGIALIAAQKIVLGSIAIAIAVIIGGSSMLSPALARKFDAAFQRVGFWAAKIVSWLLLAPLFVIVFTAVRLWHRLTRHDPLQLADSDDASYWLPSDAHERKVRHASAMFATHRIQSRRLGLPALAVLAVLAIVIAEGTLRLKGFGNPILYVTDPQVGYYPRPNQAAEREGGRVEINSFGMRAPEYPQRKAAGVFRVLMLGDSTLYGGSYVDQRELYSRQLEEHLRKTARGRRVEVLAMGVNGWGPFHELGYVEKYGTFDADLAIIALPIGDIYRPQYGLEAMPFLSAASPPRLAIEEVVHHLAWRMRTKQIGQPGPEQLQWSAERGLEAYGRLARLLTERGAEVIFEVLPTEPAAMGTIREQERRDVERLRARLAAEGPFRVAYPAGLFRGARGRLYHDDVHLHVDGHRLYARYLHDSVTRHSTRWNQWLTGKAEVAR